MSQNNKKKKKKSMLNEIPMNQ